MQTTKHLTLALVTLVLLALIAAPTQAATYTWDAEGGDTNMSTTANWDDGSGDPANTTFLTGGASTDLEFGSAGSLAQPNAGNYSVNGITFTRAFTIGSSESGDGITVGTGGVTMDNTLAGGVLMRYALKLNANTFIANNSSQNFTSLRGFEASSARSITNEGSGTNWIRLQPNGGGLNSNVTLIQDSPDSKVSLEIGNGPVAGKLEIHNGLVAWIYLGNPSSGNIVLGSETAAESDSAMLGFRHNTTLTPGTVSGTLTVSQPIVLAGTVGTNTIASGKRTYGGSFAAVNHTINWTGGVTGTNSLYLENVVDANGDDHIQFSTGDINMSGDLIHVGEGSGTATINSVIGANVTGVIQNSATSKLTLGAANLYSGNTTVQAGTLELNNVNALQNSTLDAQSGNVTFLVSGDNTYNIGGLTGSDDLAIGGNTISVGANDQTTSYSGSITGTGLTKVGDGVLTLTGSGNSVATTSVTGGTLRVNGALTSPVTVTGGATLGGTGTIDGTIAITGSTLAPGASIESLQSGALTLNDESTFAVELDSGVELDVAADLMKVSGNLTLNDDVYLTLDDLATSSVRFSAGTTFSIINYTGTWNNGLFTYSGSLLADGDIFSDGLTEWQIYYAADAGGSNFAGEYFASSRFVNLVAIPEPASFALLALAGLVLLRRRRRW